MVLRLMLLLRGLGLAMANTGIAEEVYNGVKVFTMSTR